MRVSDVRDEIDDLLRSEGRIVPDPQLAASVMRSVRREAASPPIAFPWRRAWIGIAATVAGLAIIVGMIVTARAPLPGMLSTTSGFDPSLWSWADMAQSLAEPSVQGALLLAAVACLVWVVLSRLAPIRLR